MVGDDDSQSGEVVPFPRTPEERRALRKATQEQERQRLANIFIDEAGGNGTLFHTPGDVAYADIIVAGHRETWPVRSKQFRYAYLRYLQRQIDRLTGADPVLAMAIKQDMRKTAVNAAIDDFETRALCSEIVREVYVRVAGHGDEIYIDLGTKDWEVVRIRRAGWSIIQSPPVRFRRTRGMLPLPEPGRNGRIETLRPFLNVATASDFTLVVAVLLAALRPQGPYPITALYGEHGTAKTTFLKLMRRLVDPHVVATCGLPPGKRELFIMAANSHYQMFENVSKLSDPTSDALCRLATGSGERPRQLFTDTEETLLYATRPIAFEGISNVITRADLQDRAIILPLEQLPEYKTERQILAEFERECPGIFGALLDKMVHGLANLSTTEPVKLPRMADFAHWGLACGVDQFEEAYAANRAAAVQVMLSHDLLAKTIRGTLLGRRKRWTGIMEALLDLVGPVTGIRSTKKLSDDLRRLAPMLRTVGIQVTYGKRTGEERPLRIERVS